MKKPLNLIITGVGGQGNVLASQILGQTALRKGFRVTIGETFGLSQRGGAVMSHIRLSEAKIYGPLIPPNTAHIIIGLEPLETLRIVEEYGNEETVFITNSRPIHPLNVIAGDVEYPDPEWIRNILEKAGQKLYWLNATDKALDLGGPIILNMIMLGALCALPGFPLAASDIQEVIQSIFPASKLPANVRALQLGGDMIRDYEN
ncbi:MAG: indolepyruvate oxidoreductase subunit beta [Deltaproteobacteria bacterium]|nr:indolepyruvate oxidoreductase subunit beta [Deltaproteobacteria bacterium]